MSLEGAAAWKSLQRPLAVEMCSLVCLVISVIVIVIVIVISVIVAQSRHCGISSQHRINIFICLFLQIYMWGCSVFFFYGNTFTLVLKLSTPNSLYWKCALYCDEDLVNYLH